ncbi:hypothetical protein MN608_09724 [Microdochium nivale]|nr:hypothetical protein MN608_09724 [Microdochium nivale]
MLTMTELGGQGPYCISVLWGLTALLLVFLVLRVYTRVVCVASYGVDDNLYNISIVLIILYSAFGTIACLYGYGRDDLDPAGMAKTSFWRMVAQTFAMTATATSKSSVGFFLLRLIAKPWHKVVIWSVMAFMVVASILSVVFTWVACSPIEFTWDERIEGGTCIDTIPIAASMAVGTVLVDITYAVLGWVFVWNLSNPLQEKIIIGGSLSLGLLAAAAGTVRLLSVKGVRDVPVAVIVWSQVELTTTLVCVGIAVCLPLWRLSWRKMRTLGGSSRSKSGGSGGQHGSAAAAAAAAGERPGEQLIGLYTIGGSPMDPMAPRGRKTMNKKSSMFSVFSMKTAATQRGSRARDDAGSDEVDLTSWEDATRPARNDSSPAVGMDRE